MKKIPESCSSEYDPKALLIEQARKLILDLAENIPETQLVPLAQATGRAICADQISNINVPASRCSAMDGYAIRLEDLVPGKKTEFKLVGKSLAGHPFHGPISVNTCIRITTGAIVPDDCNCVVMQENVHRENDRITIEGGQKDKQFIRDAGSDISVGQIILSKGTLIGPAQIGLLAAIGKKSVQVIRRVKIAVFSTGDELVEPGEATQSGQIYDSNRYILFSQLQSPSIDIVDLGIVADSQEALQETFDKAEEADIIISTGGVSVGEADYVKDVLETRGELHLWKVAMKPGRPLTVGKLNTGSLYFGLPGNPVSGMVTFDLFVKHAIRKTQGLTINDELMISAVCLNILKKAPGRVELQRGILSRECDNQWVVKTTGLQDSHILTSMHKANCFIRLGIDTDGAKSGEVVDVIPFLNQY